MHAANELDRARFAGDLAGELCTDKARRVADPHFAAKAERAILAHLRAAQQASGEELTLVARAHGAVPHDDRAFGSVFASLSRRGRIRTVDMCMRVRGHGTAGGRIWALSEEGDR